MSEKRRTDKRRRKALKPLNAENQRAGSIADDDPMENDQNDVVDDLPIQNLSLQPSRQGWMPRWAKRKH
jgi:hypothetical protein